MKFLITGATGMLGADVCRELARRGHEVDAPSSGELDITDPEAVATLALSRGQYDWCINCAAYTAVDKAETEVRMATEVNSIAPGYLAGACSMAGIKLMHVSTDFVFDGEATTPYTEDAPPSPLGVYGQTKRDGELAVLSSNANALIVRTSWLFGPNGKSFPRTMIGAWDAGKNLRVVADQTGCPTYTGDLARVLGDVAEANLYPGIYHASGPTVTNWHAFALAAIDAWRATKADDRPVVIEAIPTEAYPTPARRPKYSVLDNGKLSGLGIMPMRPVGVALEEFVSRLQLD